MGLASSDLPPRSEKHGSKFVSASCLFFNQLQLRSFTRGSSSDRHTRVSQRCSDHLQLRPAILAAPPHRKSALPVATSGAKSVCAENSSPSHALRTEPASCPSCDEAAPTQPTTDWRTSASLLRLCLTSKSTVTCTCTRQPSVLGSPTTRSAIKDDAK